MPGIAPVRLCAKPRLCNIPREKGAIAMAENKTRPTEDDVAAFIDSVGPDARREDARTLDTLLRRITGMAPAMWGPSIIGYGRYHYRYESGREGEMCRIGFSPRKAALVLYFNGRTPAFEALLATLGKHESGKGCLYIKRLADVDMAVLEGLAVESLAYMDAHYPD